MPDLIVKDHGFSSQNFLRINERTAGGFLLLSTTVLSLHGICEAKSGRRSVLGLLCAQRRRAGDVMTIFLLPGCKDEWCSNTRRRRRPIVEVRVPAQPEGQLNQYQAA